MPATNAIVPAADTAAAIVEQVMLAGDLARLTPQQRVSYYRHVCDSLGLNPLTRPFEYITLNSKLTLYARKDAADQLRKIYGVSITRVERESVEGVYVVTAYARDREGREDSDVGAVSIKGLSGDALANAYMKATTKAKRRVTLSICGLGMLDETEVETVRDARPVRVDMTTGEIVDAPASEPPAPAPAVVEPPAPPADAPAPAAPTGRRVSAVSRYQREKLIELYCDVYGCDDDTAETGVDAMFVQQFGHGIADGSYNEGAAITAKLLGLQRQARGEAAAAN